MTKKSVCQGRLLDESCGIGKHEQYRCISTILHKRKEKQLIGHMKGNGVGLYLMTVTEFQDYLFFWLKNMQISSLR